MTYATQADLEALDLPAAALEGVTSADIDQHLEAASSRVDTYLRGRYALPLGTPYPPEVISCTTALAAYSLLSRRGFDPQRGTDVNVRRRHEDAVAWLERLSAGAINIALGADATPSANDGGPIVSSRGGRACRRINCGPCE